MPQFVTGFAPVRYFWTAMREVLGKLTRRGTGGGRLQREFFARGRARA